MTRYTKEIPVASSKAVPGSFRDAGSGFAGMTLGED
jgi:hypothetical protein